MTAPPQTSLGPFGLIQRPQLIPGAPSAPRVLGTLASPQVDARNTAQHFVDYQVSDMVGKGVRTMMDARRNSGQSFIGNGPFVGYIQSRFDRGEGIVGRVLGFLFGGR